MTVSQIEKCFKAFNQSGFSEMLELNKWLTLRDIPIIYLNQDANIYTDEHNIRFMFHSNNNLNFLISAYGYEQGNTFILNDRKTVISNEDDGKIPLTARNCLCFYSFDTIGGFISTVQAGPAGTFYQKPTR